MACLFLKYPIIRTIMYYKSVKDLSDDVESWIASLPDGIECIVGVPRSGMLVASILSLKLNLPLAELDGFLAGRAMRSGRRLPGHDRENFFGTRRRVLVVDDCISSGRSIREVREQVAGAGLVHDVKFGCVYGTDSAPRDLCFWHTDVPKPRAFEWNILSTKDIGNYCFDLDGVLCADPEKCDNDDGERYARFVRNARPLFLPGHRIGFIVTSRLERYREQTEGWLARHEIQYGELLMLDLPTRLDRIRTGAAAPFKAEVYKETGASLFIESDCVQAQRIASLSRRYVYCVDQRQMIGPDGFASYINREGRAIGKRMRRRIGRIKSLISFRPGHVLSNS